MKDRTRATEILLVEDNPGDARLMVEAFKESATPNNLTVVTDGVDAMALLHREKPYTDATRPDIILLDLNLPKKHGHAVLEEIKNNKGLRRIPVIILTTSEAEEDILTSYNLHANCYISKPADLEQFIQITRHIEDFWLSTVELPPIVG